MNDIKCKICNNSVETFKAGRNNFKYHKCTECNFIFLDSLHVLNVENEKKRYDTHQNSIENQGYVEMFERFIKKAITPYRTNIKTILDYGSGPGAVLSELLKRKNYKVDIYDPFYSSEKVFTDKKYDLISSTEVFEHFFDPIKEITRLNNLLNPSGIIALMTNFIPDDIEFSKWWYINDETHISFFHISTFKKIAEIFKFEYIIADNKNICILKKIL